MRTLLEQDLTKSTQPLNPPGAFNKKNREMICQWRIKKGNRELSVCGFSLIELMIVVAIAGTLAAIAVPNYIKFREKGKVAVAITDIRFIEVHIMNYQLDVGEFPDSFEDLSAHDFIDPWGNPYQYLRIEGGKTKGKKAGKPRKDHFLVPVNSDYDLYSMGRDGKSVAPFTAKASRDDIVRANNGGYVGYASDY